jgi:hypothetical protein
MSEIISILYISESTKHFDISFDIDKILNKANNFNKNNNISGMLIYKGGLFIQLLEGEKSCLELLMSRIKEDSRHDKLRIIYEETTQERLFSNWTMAYKNSDIMKVDIQKKIDDFINIYNEENYTIENKKILTFLKNIRFSF